MGLLKTKEFLKWLSIITTFEGKRYIYNEIQNKSHCPIIRFHISNRAIILTKYMGVCATID